MGTASKTKKRRKLRKKEAGKDSRKQRAHNGTPPFPIDPAKAGPNSAEKRAKS